MWYLWYKTSYSGGEKVGCHDWKECNICFWKNSQYLKFIIISIHHYPVMQALHHEDDGIRRPLDVINVNVTAITLVIKAILIIMMFTLIAATAFS